MKKLLSSSVLFLFVLISTSYASWIPFNDQSQPTEPTITMLNADWNEISLQSEINGVYAKELETERGNFTVLSIIGSGFTTEIASPKLPVIRQMIEIPYNADFEIEIIDVSYTEATLEEIGIYQIMPVQPPLVKLEGATVEFAYNEDAYNQNAFYPAEDANIKDVGIIRGHRVVMAEINPVRYNPATGELRLINNISLKINLTNSDVNQTIEKNQRYSSKQFDEIYEYCKKDVELTRKIYYKMK